MSNCGLELSLIYKIYLEKLFRVCVIIQSLFSMQHYMVSMQRISKHAKT